MSRRVEDSMRGPVSSEEHQERLWPTAANLDAVLAAYPDHRQRYEFAMDYVRGKEIADIASGAGYGTYLMGKLARAAKGFDISEEALAHARRHFGSANVSFENVSAIGTDAFDVIVSFETIEHMTEQDGDLFLRRLSAALRKPDGLLVISTPINRSDKKINVTPYHLREYDEEEFSRKLELNGFKVLRRFGQCNSVSAKLAEQGAFGVSIGGVIKTGLHRIVPKFIRRRLVRAVLGNELRKVNDTFTIVPDDLHAAAVQIAVCRPR